MRHIELKALQDLRIPFENQLWELFLNDPYFKIIEPEIENDYIQNISNYINNVKEKSRNISRKSKEITLLKDLCNKLKLEREIQVFELNEPKKFKTVSCYHKDNLTIIVISKPINKVLLERELIPIFAHEFGHLIFQSPIPIFFEFLQNKLTQSTCIDEQNNILRLLYLTNVFQAINEYNCDRLALYLTSFEAFLCSLIQIDKVNNRKYKLFNIETLIRKFPNFISESCNELVEYYLSPNYRYYAMFLFSKEHNLIESYSLQNMYTKLDITTIINPVKITKNYYKLLNQKHPKKYITQLYNAFNTVNINI